MDINQPIALIAPSDRIKETITRLSRVGFDHVIGYLDGGMDAWRKAGMEVDTIKSISTDEFAEALARGEVENILDVRRPSEFAAEHIKDANSFPLDYINEYLG
jgi:rhodanese-related sulfurtransferase